MPLAASARMTPASRRVPVVVLTGFLGAGKTTLLRQVIAEGALSNTAILINEFGEVGIDHHLIREVRGNTVLLGGGCACCAVHGDFVRAMVELYSQAARGEGPRYDRVILETSGIADPTTLVAALSQHRVLAAAFELQAVVTVVDAVLGAETLRVHPEAAKQVALADRIIISKCDAATAAQRHHAIAVARQCNPLAPIVEPSADAARAPLLTELATMMHQPPNATPRAADPEACGEHCAALDHAHPPQRQQAERHHHHASAGAAHFITTAAVYFAGPVRPGPLSMWLSIMTQMHGEKLLRIKGIVRLDVEQRDSTGAAPAYELHCVQHLVYPARALPAWPDADPRNRLVFIARGMSQQMLDGLARNLVETLGNPLS